MLVTRAVVVSAGVLALVFGMSGNAGAAEGPVQLDSGLSLNDDGFGGDATVGVLGHEVGVGTGSDAQGTGLAGGAKVPLVDGGCDFGAGVGDSTPPSVHCGLLGGQVGVGSDLPVGDQPGASGLGANVFGHELNVPVTLPLRG